jgi:transcriptional regulator with XRE-family HTH domain
LPILVNTNKSYLFRKTACSRILATVSTKTDFVAWLNKELKDRGWSNSELARRAGVVPSTVSMVLSGKNEPTWEFCAATAAALDEPPEKVFRLVGLLPPLPGPERDVVIQQLVDSVKNLTPDDREEVLAYAQFRYQRKAKRDK